MATLSYVTTPDEDAAIAFVVAARNAERAAQGLQSKTAEEYFTDLVQSAIASYTAQKTAYEAEQIKAAFAAADAATKTEVKTALGVA